MHKKNNSDSGPYHDGQEIDASRSTQCNLLRAWIIKHLSNATKRTDSTLEAVKMPYRWSNRVIRMGSKSTCSETVDCDAHSNDAGGKRLAEVVLKSTGMFVLFVVAIVRILLPHCHGWLLQSKNFSFDSSPQNAQIDIKKCMTHVHASACIGSSTTSSQFKAYNT